MSKAVWVQGNPEAIKHLDARSDSKSPSTSFVMRFAASYSELGQHKAKRDGIDISRFDKKQVVELGHKMAQELAEFTTKHLHYRGVNQEDIAIAYIHHDEKTPDGEGSACVHIINHNVHLSSGKRIYPHVPTTNKKEGDEEYYKLVKAVMCDEFGIGSGQTVLNMRHTSQPDNNLPRPVKQEVIEFNEYLDELYVEGLLDDSEQVKYALLDQGYTVTAWLQPDKSGYPGVQVTREGYDKPITLRGTYYARDYSYTKIEDRAKQRAKDERLECDPQEIIKRRSRLDELYDQRVHDVASFHANKNRRGRPRKTEDRGGYTEQTTDKGEPEIKGITVEPVTGFKNELPRTTKEGFTVDRRKARSDTEDRERDKGDPDKRKSEVEGVIFRRRKTDTVIDAETKKTAILSHNPTILTTDSNNFNITEKIEHTHEQTIIRYDDDANTATTDTGKNREGRKSDYSDTGLSEAMSALIESTRVTNTAVMDANRAARDADNEISRSSKQTSIADTSLRSTTQIESRTVRTKIQDKPRADEPDESTVGKLERAGEFFTKLVRDIKQFIGSKIRVDRDRPEKVKRPPMNLPER